MAKRHLILIATLVALAVPLTATARGERVKSFSGTGVRILPPIHLRAWTTVRWHATGHFFILIALKGPKAIGPNPQVIQSQALQGTSSLPPGRYVFKIAVWTDSHWRIKFSTP